MRFALINDNRVEAQPELKRLCSCCSNPVIAKCGTRKIWHWAHKSNTDCDNWWELARTIGKKYRCLMKVQEKKHIADFRTAHNLVIEFQHSHIDQQERTSREMFYKKADFIKLVGIALIIATPLDYIAANKWLQNYPYRI